MTNKTLIRAGLGAVTIGGITAVGFAVTGADFGYLLAAYAVVCAGVGMCRIAAKRADNERSGQ